MAKKQSIDKRRWSLAAGIWWGGAMLILGLLATWFSIGNSFIDLIGSLYIGFTATYLGAVIGGVLGFIDMFIGVWILLWLYEKLPASK